MIDIRTALEQAQWSLKIAKIDARLEAEILLCHTLNKSRAYLFAHPEELIDDQKLQTYQLFIRERAKGVPIAYITGNREFWSLSLTVNAHTLIPRHETERLVELTLAHMADKQQVTILDLGTGSGAIALALAKEKPNWQIDACDYSIEALRIAKENAKNNGINNVFFYHSDWFKNIPQKRYQVIISNPPYIDENDPHLQQGDLRFEPLSALVSGQEGLADLQYIIEHSYDYLMPEGLLLLEHGYDQKSSVQATLNKIGYKNIQVWQDIQGHDRVSSGWHP